MKNQGTV